MRCERVYYIADNPEIAWRDGEVELDPYEQAMMVSQKDREGVLTAESGLQVGDFAVFMRFRPISDDDSTPAEGYLVSRVDDDGSGILVHSKLAEAHPESYAEGRISEQWRYLEGIDPNIFQEFSLSGLESYLRLRRTQQEQ